MITLKNIWTKGGYSGHDHLLPDAQDVFADLIGRRFASVREIKRAVERNDTQYRAFDNKWCFARNMMMGAEVIHADGSVVTIDV